jgi:hypothetical protein
MSIRKRPSAQCSKCGRTVTLVADAAPVATEHDLNRITTACLLPHKCSHGSWCHECQQSHGGWGGWRPGAGAKEGVRLHCGECRAHLTAREWRYHFNTCPMRPQLEVEQGFAK